MDWSVALRERLHAVRERIAAAERAAGRVPGSVRLLAATKTLTVDQALAAVDAGLDLVSLIN